MNWFLCGDDSQADDDGCVRKEEAAEALRRYVNHLADPGTRPGHQTTFGQIKKEQARRLQQDKDSDE